MRLVRVPPEGQDRLVFEQQQLVTDRVVGALLREALLELPRIAIRDPAQPPDVQAHGVGAGAILLLVHGATIAGGLRGTRRRPFGPSALRGSEAARTRGGSGVETFRGDMWKGVNATRLICHVAGPTAPVPSHDPGPSRN